MNWACRSGLLGNDGPASKQPQRPPLSIHGVGDFAASFIPSQADFERLDPRFRIGPEVWAAIPSYKDYGFAVFQLAITSGAPHPIAFTFRTRMPDAVFFPTVHIHDGIFHEQDDFNHELFMQDSSFEDGLFRRPRPIERYGFHRSNEVAGAFAAVDRAGELLDQELHVFRARMEGNRKNEDVTVAVDAAGARLGCGGCDAGSAPAGWPWASAAAAGSLGWIIRRRNLLGRQQEE